MLSNIDGPRIARPDEFQEAITLTEQCFDLELGGLKARMPHCFDESHPERHAIVKRDGSVVSHVVCVPAELRAGDARVDCHGIAGVATHPDHRGNGYMTQLLEFWLDRLAERDVPLTELEGDRVGYGEFGWENAGREYRYRLSRRSFDARRSITVESAVGDTVRPYRETTADLESIERVHERERYCVSRDRMQYEQLLSQRGLETLVCTADRPAYLCHRGEDPTAVLEFGGARDGVAALLDRVLEERNEVILYTHPDHPDVPLFREVAIDWELVPHRKLNVLDLVGLFEAYAPLLKERWSQARDAIGSADGAVTLSIVGDGRYPPGTANADTVTLEYGEFGVRVEHTDRQPDVELNRRTMTDFLFGERDAYRRLNRSHPFLASVLPLEYYFWQTETI